jgi:hypothetical protein
MNASDLSPQVHPIGKGQLASVDYSKVGRFLMETTSPGIMSTAKICPCPVQKNFSVCLEVGNLPAMYVGETWHLSDPRLTREMRSLIVGLIFRDHTANFFQFVVMCTCHSSYSMRDVPPETDSGYGNLEPLILAQDPLHAPWMFTGPEPMDGFLRPRLLPRTRESIYRKTDVYNVPPLSTIRIPGVCHATHMFTLRRQASKQFLPQCCFYVLVRRLIDT